MISNLKQIAASIGAKIILPYFILTLLVAAVGAYIVTTLVASTVTERFENQLLDAGRIVAENIVMDEEARLKVLRTIATTEGVPEALAVGDVETLARRVEAIAINEGATAVSVVNLEALEVVGWRQSPDQTVSVPSANADFSPYADVQRVLAGQADDFSDRRVFLAEVSSELMLFTVAPVILNNGIVGAVIVGTNLQQLAIDLSGLSLARITLYDREGRVLATALGGEVEDGTIPDSLEGSPEQYTVVLERLRESPEQVDVIIANENEQVLLRRTEVLNQEYLLAYGNWRLRGQSFGLFSVALPANFITRTVTTNQTWLAIIFFVATLTVFLVGIFLAQRITKPLKRLVVVSTAVAQGDLNQSTEIERNDEIGVLANSFDIMTRRLAERNRQLVEQASKLEAILNSISDAVIVFDNDNQIVATNPAAQNLLKHLTYHKDTPATYLQSSNANIQSGLRVDTLMALDTMAISTTRFRVGGRIFGISASPFKTPTGTELGRVIVLHDVTRQAEAEQLKDGFITSISHELRTPLTSMKGYIHLLSSKNSSNLTEQQAKFIEIIQNSTELLATHVNKLIDITSIQDESLKLNKRRESLTEIVIHQTNEWRKQMESKGLTFQVDLDEDSLWVIIDRIRLDWAIENILRNAYQYTGKDGKVIVRVFPQNGHACLTIRDTGVGISAVDQPYIFSRFYRAQNELTLSVPGLGIELFIAKSIVEAHNGHIWVESELGQGSLFGIDLPLDE